MIVFSLAVPSTAFAQVKPSKGGCPNFKAEIKKIPTRGYSCCYAVSIIRPVDLETLQNLPFSFEIKTSSGTQIVSKAFTSSNLITIPTSIPPATNSIVWKDKNNKPLGTGKINLGNICLNTNGDSWIYFIWYNKQNKILCKDSTRINCESSWPSTCCALSMNFENKPNNLNKYKKIRVTALSPSKIINATSDDWEQSLSTPNMVEWFLQGNQDIPYGEVIDNEFMLYLDPSTSTQVLQVDWLDNNGLVKCRHIIKIPCEQSYVDDQDWFRFTNLTSINDPDRKSVV